MKAEKRAPSRKAIGLAAMTLAGLVVVGIALVTLLVRAQAPVFTQPIQFSHQTHVKQMACIFCHRFYETREVAGRPERTRCLMCHAYRPAKNPEAQKLLRLAKTGQPLPWVRVTRLFSAVRFSHQRHVAVARLDCATCHGDMAALTAPPAAPQVTINMQFCLNCHRADAVQIREAGFESLGGADLSPEVLTALTNLKGVRFRSPDDFLAALKRRAGTIPPEAAKSLILAQLQPAGKVTTDCIACHR